MKSSLIATLAATAAFMMACNNAPMLLEDAEVNTRESAIVNGSVETGYLPVGALHSGKQSGCTATLVGKRTVLTAAHCVTTKDAPYSLLQPVNFYVGGFCGGIKYPAASVIVHPSYAGGNKADIAVVRLSQDVVGVTPKEVSSSPPTVGETVLLVGYGKTGENSGAFGTKRRATNKIAQVQSQIFRMNGASGAFGNICDGDSGGPTFASRGGREVMIGVHSTRRGDCGQEGNDMRVDVFYQWIAKQADGDLQNGGPIDKASPKVQILKPFPNAVISPNFTVQVQASDDVGLTKVVLFVSGKQAAQLTSAPFTFNLQNLPLGKATIEAVAYGQAGHTTSATANVIVQTLDSGTQPRPFGSSCQSGTQCQSTLCVNDASGLLCSRACTSPLGCPNNYGCLQGVCRAKSANSPQSPGPQGTPPGTFGASCNNHSECNSFLCADATATGRNFCTTTCDLTANNCPGGAICHPAGAQAVCGLPTGKSGLDDSVEGGCSVGHGAASDGAPLLLLLGLALIVLLRPRR